MTGIILCEGLTDQVLLSKYFCGRFGFAFERFEDFLNAVDWASYEKIHQGFQSFDCVMNGKIEE